MILWQQPVLALLIGYFLGSIPFGVILTRIAGAGDLRQIGSGNIGATNVLRTGRKGLAAATLLLDMLKGAAAICLVGYLFGDDLKLLAGVGAFVGHCWPVWLKFKGGKGVATLMGIVAALSWQVGLIYALVWLLMLALTRISSLAGMAAALSAPVASFFFGRLSMVPMALGLALLVLWKHRDNIGRLLRGEEPKVGGSKPAPAADEPL